MRRSPLAIEQLRWRLRDNAGKIGKSGDPWQISNLMSFTQPFFLGPVFFRAALPCSGGYHLERGGMPLHDAVKMAPLLKIKTQVSSIWAKGCMFNDCVCVLSDLT